MNWFSWPNGMRIDLDEVAAFYPDYSCIGDDGKPEPRTGLIMKSGHEVFVPEGAETFDKLLVRKP